MDGERIRSEQDARDLRDKYHRVTAGTSDVTVQVGPRGDHRVSGIGMDGFELTPQEMRQTASDLDHLYGQLEGYLRTAERELTTALPDGTSPVASKMRWVFLDRADQAHGIPAVLRGYMNELAKIRSAIHATLAAHQQRDEEAADAVRGADRGEGI